MWIGKKHFEDSGKTYIMGILNMTPDSFSDGGKIKTVDEALFRVEQMINEGMDVLDIGGESTRPGYTVVSEVDEINRLLGVLRAVKERFDIPVSIDTYKPGTARTLLGEGADMINDIFGLNYDDEMAKVVAEADAAYCLMHQRDEANYSNLLREVMADIDASLKKAEYAGIAPDKIMIDPGIGFGKNVQQNLVILKHLEEFHTFGYPILLGTSRKSVIGKTLELPVTERVEGTLATTVMAVMQGVSFVRVHDIKENRRVIDMTEAILASDC